MSKIDGTNTPLVSIIVLTYKRFDGLWNTLETVVQQDYENWELIVSDDGSDNFPIEEIEKWIRHKGITAGKVYKNDQNKGIVAHSNFAARKSNGEYIKFLPPGDGFCSSGALTALVEAAGKTESCIVTSPALVYVGEYSNVRYRYPSKKGIRMLKTGSPQQLFSSLSARNIVSAVGTMYHRSFFENGGFDEEYRNLDDWPTWLSQFRAGKRLEIVEEPTVYYELAGISNSEGNALHSKLLRPDMIHCFEKEILPYRERLTAFSRWRVNYCYGILENDQTVRFKIQYFPMLCYDKLKQKIKRIVTNSSWSD